LAGGLNISVSLPESIEIKMVDASVLNDYEVWAFIASLLSSGFVGFLVATIQAYDINSPTKEIWRGVTIIIGLLFVLAGGRAWNQRKRLSKRSKNVSLKVVGAGQE
jgi:peptidoglycan/LPS O-acetylase OafA/YrhL